jgi:hypothetical protein
MKLTTLTPLLAGLSALVLGALASAAPPTTINPVDAKAAIRKASDAALADLTRGFPELRFEDPCAREYNDAVKEAGIEARACLDPDHPPAGSPLAAFNALTNAQLASFCGDKTLDACVASVVKEQQKFCAINAAKAKSRAKTAQQKCCSAFAARKKELEAELKAINDRLAICLGN